MLVLVAWMAHTWGCTIKSLIITDCSYHNLNLFSSQLLTWIITCVIDASGRCSIWLDFDQIWTIVNKPIMLNVQTESTFFCLERERERKWQYASLYMLPMFKNKLLWYWYKYYILAYGRRVLIYMCMCVHGCRTRCVHLPCTSLY